MNACFLLPVHSMHFLPSISSAVLLSGLRRTSTPRVRADDRGCRSGHLISCSFARHLLPVIVSALIRCASACTCCCMCHPSSCQAMPRNRMTPRMNTSEMRCLMHSQIVHLLRRVSVTISAAAVQSNRKKIGGRENEEPIFHHTLTSSSPLLQGVFRVSLSDPHPRTHSLIRRESHTHTTSLFPIRGLGIPASDS